MRQLKETTFGNVVLGATVVKNGVTGQKIDEPIGGGKNKHGQSSNMRWSQNGNSDNLKKDAVVKTTYFLTQRSTGIKKCLMSTARYAEMPDARYAKKVKDFIKKRRTIC